MRIAVLGAGFAGLAVTWHLLQLTQGACTVDLFDPSEIGGGVSGLSSGLLHPYGGLHARRGWNAEKGIEAAHKLFTEASRAIAGPVVLSKGILRPATSAEQNDDFQLCAKQHPEDTQWWNSSKCEEFIPGLNTLWGGLYIATGLTIDVKGYMQGLWQACARLGTQLHARAMTQENEIEKYDKVIVAVGSGIKSFKVFNSLPIKLIKGQTLLMSWPSNLPPLPLSLVSQGYLVMAPGGKACIAGATFERNFTSGDPDPEVAIPLIRQKIEPFFPSLKDAQVLECKAGVRATAPTHHHLPFIGRLSNKIWFMTGLGSKGLLYHAWMAERLAQAILANDPSFVPKELWYTL